MRAWQLHDTTGPEALALDEIDEPQPGPAQVRVALKVIGLNHLDLWVSRGLPAPGNLPHILGADGAGTIDSVGEGVAGWDIGDEVIVNPSMSCGKCDYCLHDQMVYCRSYQILGEHDPGTLAEKVVLPATSLMVKPPTLDWPTAGTFGLVTGTAYRMLSRARLQPKETALVVGVGGGVSSAAMAIALAQGARVFVTSRSSEKIAWAVGQGAEAGFDSAGEFAKDLKQATGGGADVVVENVGDATWGQSIRSLNPGGRIVVCGATAGNKVQLTLPVLWFKQLEIIGSTMFTRSEFARVLNMVENGKVPVPVDRIYPFEELPQALARLDAGEQMGKIGLELV
ncbi:MAG TPA: zinc-binding dehydrogenase [Acidimicrobiia bacterium]|nr:zinc-binding dehydrogenase [Acidimicrobiia bacterium]